MDEEWFKRARGAGIIGSLLLISCLLILLVVPCLEPIEIQGKGGVALDISERVQSIPTLREDSQKPQLTSTPEKKSVQAQDLVTGAEASSHETSQGKEKKPPFEDIILEASQRYGVDPALIRAMIMAESGYNPRAISKKGAQGLMQLMPSTAKELGVSEPFDPVHNIHGGVKYFRRLLDRFNGDVKLALAAYNAGSTKVRKYKGIPPIRATRYYIDKVFYYYKIYKDQMNLSTDDA